MLKKNFGDSCFDKVLSKCCGAIKSFWIFLLAPTLVLFTDLGWPFSEVHKLYIIKVNIRSKEKFSMQIPKKTVKVAFDATISTQIKSKTRNV